MKPEELNALKSGDLNQMKIAVRAFNEKYANLFDFKEFNANGQWIEIWKAIFSILRDDKNSEIYSDALSCIRILARDENNIRTHDILKDFDCLLKLANLTPAILVTGKTKPISQDVTIEALKCLCNVVYLSADCQKACYRNSSTDGIIKRVSSDTNYPFEIEYFDMKLLFLITALEPSTRNKVRDDLNGLTYLTEWLDLKAKDRTSRTDKDKDLICEILKVLFNITTDKTSNENEILYRRLTAVARNLLLEYGDSNDCNDKDKAVVTGTIHLLTNVPSFCMIELITGGSSLKCSSSSSSSSRKESTGGQEPEMVDLFEGKCIKAVKILLQYLRNALNEKDKSPANNEQLPPILTVLIKCSRSNPILRHYIRSIILPPLHLKDIKKRPEQGNELRNHLCRFLTLPQMTIRDLAADLLFILCKENVGRMIKYTGYGNAAGLFAKRGLLDGGRKQENTEYSSDSEDSDTEEYKKVQHEINPVLGCYEPSKSKPLEGMSEEQKEYEAVQLVNLMDKLQRQGILQPCKIDEDGRPQPIEHILELQEELPQQQIDKKQKT